MNVSSAVAQFFSLSFMGRDIYHFILLALVDELHLSGLHVFQMFNN